MKTKIQIEVTESEYAKLQELANLYSKSIDNEFLEYVSKLEKEKFCFSMALRIATTNCHAGQTSEE